MAFSVYHKISEYKGVETNVSVDFRTKREKQSRVRKSHQLKLESYYAYRKMEIVIRCLFSSVDMSLNLIQFPPKVGFNIALGSFT